MSRHYFAAVGLVVTSIAGAWGIEARAQDRTRLPPGTPGTVTLPVADYDRLIDRAALEPGRADLPPVAAVIGRAEVRARVDAGQVRGSVLLDGEVFQRGGVKVPLVAGATVLDARADGRPLPLTAEGDTHAAVLSGPAPFALTLDWAAATAGSPGRASVRLPQPAGGTATAVIDLPGDPADVRAEPGLLTARTTSSGRTVVEIMLARGAATVVSWSVRETATSTAAEPRILADVKSLVTIGESDLRLTSIIDITVVRGEPRTFGVQVPAGYEMTGATGSTLESADPQGNVITLTVRGAAERRHQFVLGFERAHDPGSFKAETFFPTVTGVQRETAEAAVEGTGTIEVAATGDANLRRMDVREVHAGLRQLARQPLLAAFRYQRQPNEPRSLTLDVKRFPDAAVLIAAAEHVSATTLVTSEGRMLTEVSLRLTNRAQPFMKVELPAGARMLSVEVAGETAKPASDAGATRIPLLRPGFRPDGPYSVSFVYLHERPPFAARGDAHITLPTLDLPVGVLEWELFLPERYSAKPVAGNVIPGVMAGNGAAFGSGAASGSGSGFGPDPRLDSLRPAQLAGRITDPAGGPIPGASITVVSHSGIRRTATTGVDGVYVVNDVPAGEVTVMSDLAGFVPGRRSFTFDGRPRRLDFQLAIQSMTETLTVAAEAAKQRENAGRQAEVNAAVQAPTQNVINLQRRVAGVLPVRIDVPRTGTLHRFVRPLVLQEETRVTFRYKVRR